MAQTMVMPQLHIGDTLYLSRDLLPLPVDLAETGEGQYWDMARLLSPFVCQSLVRPDQNGGIIFTGPDDIDRYLTVKKDGLFMTRLGLPDMISGGRTIAVIDPPVPYIKSIRFADTWSYTGTITIPSPQTGCELRFKLTIQAEVEGQGEVNSPTARYDVLRERRDVDITSVKGTASEEINWPTGFMPGRAYFFHSSSVPFPVAIVQTDAMNKAKQVEYITHPWAGQVIQQVPRRPDIFVYPNPSFGVVRFDLLNLPTGYYDLEIYNILGMLIRTERVFTNGIKTLALDLSRMKKGTYIYRLVDSQKNTIRSKRLVIITP
jgi:hypothetical protein